MSKVTVFRYQKGASRDLILGCRSATINLHTLQLHLKYFEVSELHESGWTIVVTDLAANQGRMRGRKSNHGFLRSKVKPFAST
jgi:hypothetical protein